MVRNNKKTKPIKANLRILTTSKGVRQKTEVRSQRPDDDGRFTPLEERCYLLTGREIIMGFSTKCHFWSKRQMKGFRNKQE